MNEGKKKSKYCDGQDPSAEVVRKKLDPHHSRASSAQLEAITTQGYAHLPTSGVGRGGLP